MNDEEALERIKDIECSKEDKNKLLTAWRSGKSDVFAETLLGIISERINRHRLGLEIIRNKYMDKIIYHKAEMSRYDTLVKNVDKMIKNLG